MGLLPQELEAERVKILKIAEDHGLDMFDTVFEMVSYDQLNEVAAKGGFPVRYPHWRFGMDYEQLSKGYEYGLSKIYELVINHDPCYAYLMEGNEFLDQKLVMAHVYGHCDFFKNNMWFSQTDRRMIDTMANHSTRIRRYIDIHGLDTVEDFIDKCLSIENLIDVYAPYQKHKVELPAREPEVEESKDNEIRPYMESYMRKSDVLGAEEKKEEKPKEPDPRPRRDILSYLIEFAPLEDWQADVLGIIRNEAYYFAPQGMTKIMNEGWASYWHSKLMTEQIMKDCDVIDFADRHSGTMAMAPNGFNPYKIGIELMRNIEWRWDKGQYGLEWSECTDMAARSNWDTGAMKGREKIFQVRRDYNDVMFIDEFLTEEFCIKNKMFVYKFNKRTGQFELDTRDFKSIKAKLLFQLTNHGNPIMSVVDGNHDNKGELLLTHLFEGVEMQPDYMKATMENLFPIWQKPVNVATVMDGEPRIFRYDGKEFTHSSLSDQPTGEDLPKGS